jgi:hypothetical protein
VSADFPRQPDAVRLAATALRLYHNASVVASSKLSSLADKQAVVSSLQELRTHLPGCIRVSESVCVCVAAFVRISSPLSVSAYTPVCECFSVLQELGLINCSTASFEGQVQVPCLGTCGTNLAKLTIPAFSLLASFLLFNMSAALMIEARQEDMFLCAGVCSCLGVGVGT